jgi:flagellar hook protein FlgE
LGEESSTDLAITGDGFFILNGGDGQSYSRNGGFHFDKDGKLINSDNCHVIGFQADENGKIIAKLGEIGLDKTVIDAKKTSDVKLFMNLDLRSEKSMIFDPEHPDQTSHFATGVTVYDTAGTAHVCTVYVNRTDDGVWTWRGMIKGEEVMNGKPGQMAECARGTLKFDSDGRLREQKLDKSSFNFNKGALPNQYIRFDFGSDKMHGGDGLAVTQYGSHSEAYKTLQDGYTAGNVAGMSFSDDGILSAIYTNGENIKIAQVALAKFENPESLFKVGQNRFRESKLSGQPTMGAPESGGRGRISSKAIEASTTDVANEFINLMQAQRNFQANSKVVSTSDELLQEIINLKRS